MSSPSSLAIALTSPLSIAQLAGTLPLLQKLSSHGTDGEVLLNHVAIDSRECTAGSVFFALRGQKVDGHNYLENLAGTVPCAVVAAEWLANNRHVADVCLAKGLQLLVVHDPLVALQVWAQQVLARMPNLQRIGVTGSSGKTTVKDMLKTVFATVHATWASPGNMNSVIGLPLAILAMPANTRYAIFEMGISERGEMAVLADLVFPGRAIITSLGTAHIGNIGSRQGIAEEKIKISTNFKSVDTLYLPADSPWFDLAVAKCPGKVYSFGMTVLKGASWRSAGANGEQAILWDGITIPLALGGEHIRNDAAGVVAIALDCGISLQDIARGFAQWQPGQGRGTIHHGAVTIVEDCYNANPDSMSASIAAFLETDTSQRRVLILGDMRELGETSAQAHAAIGRQVAASAADQAIFFGPEMTAAYTACQGQSPAMVVQYCNQFEELVACCSTCLHAGDRILLKASRGMALERLIPYLDSKELSHV